MSDPDKRWDFQSNPLKNNSYLSLFGLYRKIPKLIGVEHVTSLKSLDVEFGVPALDGPPARAAA
jgi:hypothetical protein